jgi:hypothetical protein
MRFQISFIASMISSSVAVKMSVTWLRHEMPGQVLQRHLQPIGDGFGRVIGDDVPGLETAIGVIGLFRARPHRSCTPGAMLDTVRQVPEIMPPPPMGAMTHPAPHLLHELARTGACPAITRGSL